MRYAIIKDSMCVNTIIADRDYAQAFGAVEIPDEYGIGDYWMDGEWTHELPEEPDLERRITDLETDKADRAELDAISAAIERGLSV